MGRSKFSQEELEGIQEQIRQKSISYDYRTRDYPFELISEKFGDEKLYIPDYLRAFVWRPERQSKFIESVLLGVPLTPFLVSEDKDGRLEIIDGSQRIRTLIAFSENKLRLRGLEILDRINDAKFKDLPRYFQNRVMNRDFKFIEVSGKADISVRKDIFERINTSSERLSDSEMRKVSYSGPFYDLILELRHNTDFRDVCPVTPEKEKRGEYEELILRFFAYIDRYEEFKHDVAAFLDSYLDDMNNTNFDRKYYLKSFDNMVGFIKRYFPAGFRKEKKSKSTPRVRFEAIAVGVHLALKEKPDLVPQYMDWLDSKEFAKETTSDSSNNPGKLKSRVEFVRDCLLNVKTKDKLMYG